MHTPKGNLQLKLQSMDLNLLLQGQQLTRSLTFTQPWDTLEFPSETRATCLGTIDQLSPALPSPTPPSPKDTIWHPIIESGKQLQPNSSHSIGKMAKATLLTFSANIGLCMYKTTILCQFGLFCHQLTTISPSILIHFWWELYQLSFVRLY